MAECVCASRLTVCSVLEAREALSLLPLIGHLTLMMLSFADYQEVDLPDAKNQLKIFKIILAQENMESGFPFEQLANATEGYSGSDLKNLCIAIACRPVQELLEEENKVNN
ncbi:uncharacterized protein [Primulina eburnea]|uniref:uncharacterized protein n=1 Tax=Primulina eburnea TaxID=1245227 RepID=UPI003C6C5052